MSVEDCQYIAHENGVHEFVMHKSSRQGVDIQLNVLAKLIEITPTETPILVLSDLRESGLPPLRYAMTRAKDLSGSYFSKKQSMDEQHRTYVAYVISMHPLLQTFKLFIEQLARGNTRMRFFDDRESAVNWLLGERIVSVSHE